ncbi:hypothetical protein D1816_17940 [Aquimarina sp. AD10]|uniref:Uncharacterized protein n=1 Tax=Aquimarina aggregata TaxID=1642818 RepID=A0A162ZKB3_9FLAO|nr:MULTISPECIES: hypothetical protein [Aquimarina]AXT62159.1 hypothetical protein D1816_17940 [Aquimarina sp. AD10]KZS39852.1 hypothetical protein AWE51_09405 [Aquimarina aggregata]RKM90646.1 hypothetical protein D7033_24440 [Aquimarina sp. AD10]
MKNRLKKKLNFEKLTIAKLNNIDRIRGGYGDGDTVDPPIEPTKSTDPFNPRCRSKGACVIGIINIA